MTAVSLCDEVKAFVSREIVVAILEDVEAHIDFLETEIAPIDKVGLQDYLQSRMKTDE